MQRWARARKVFWKHYDIMMIKKRMQRENRTAKNDRFCFWKCLEIMLFKEGWWIFVLLIFFMWPVVFLVTMMKRWLFSRGGFWQHLTLLDCPPGSIFFTYISQSTRIRHLVIVICKFWDFVGLFFRSDISFLCVLTGSGTLLCCSSWSIFQFVFPYLNRLQSPLRHCDLWCMWWRNTFFLH